MNYRTAGRSTPIATEWTGAPFLANSVPKSGTHLLKKCLSLFPGLRQSEYHVEMHMGPEAMREFLNRIPRGMIITGHLPGFEQFVQLFRNLGFKTILIIRDPRDVAVSFVQYVVKDKKHYLYSHYAQMQDDDMRLIATIRGIEREENGGRIRALENIREYWRVFQWWLKEDINLVVRFEDLVGPAGGGSREAQIQEVVRMAAHLGVNLPNLDIERIAEGAFDPSAKTFRKGMIGDWRNHFSPEHERVFKEVAGELLIELGYEQDLNWKVDDQDRGT